MITKEITTIDELRELTKVVREKGYCAIDTEFTPLENKKSKLSGISFSHTIDEGYYYHCPNLVRNSAEWFLLHDVLDRSNIRKYFHNAKPDIQCLWQSGFIVKNVFFDTMVAHYLIDPIGRHGLKRLSNDYYSVNYGDELDKWFKEPRAFNEYYDLHREKAVTYASMDAIMTLKLAEKFKPVMEKKFKTLFFEIEMQCVPILAHMEMYGLKVHREHLNSLHSAYMKAERTLERWVCDIGTPIIKESHENC